MTTNQLENAGLNSNPQEKTLRSTAIRTSVLSTGERLGIKFKLGHALRENNLTKRITSLLSGERKKKKMCRNNCKQIADI